ncbi:MAG: ADP-glyceromanno-heptose 6-epimerase [Planctomycetes bacterium]|nr:ADP-glyceromanno-heptose 6-epimerase [Planctomycetota bacterium]
MSRAPILVTGAAGFIGARFVESCNRRGVPLISVDAPAHFTSRAEHAGLSFGTILDRATAEAKLAALRIAPRAIVHLGACTDTTELDENLLADVNVRSSQALWNAARAQGIPFVYASSAATYGAGERGWSDHEADFADLQPLNPYGESKRRFDVWALDQERADAGPPAWAGFKFFNVYGFGERHKGRMASVVLQAFDQIRNTGRVRLFRSHKPGVADGHQARDFVFVGDVVDVLWFAIESPIRRGVFNLGSGKARSFLDLARAVFAALGVKERIEWIDTPVDIRERYQYFTEADLRRLREAGYAKAFTALEDGVRRTVERLLASASPVGRDA